MTLFSVLRQSDPRFRVSLVCHEIPLLPKCMLDAVDLVKVNYDPPEMAMHRLDKRRDKYLKQAIGLSRALEMGSDFVMFVDADDLVSRDISAMVHRLDPEHGLIMRRGYVLDQNSGLLWDVDRFDSLCGTCAAFRIDSGRMANFTASLLSCNRPDFLIADKVDFEPQYFFGRHNDYEPLALKEGIPLDITRVPLTLYRWGHGDNSNSAKSFKLSWSKKVRHYLPSRLSNNKRWVPRKRDASLAMEFGII